jgi:hypothetical protein
MAKHLVAGKAAIVFQNFPATLGPAPFFAQENENALRYLYPRRVSLTNSAISALETGRGYYLHNEIDRYGVASMYLPAKSVLDVVYRSEHHGRIVYTLGDRRYETSRFYSVRRRAVSGPASGPRPIQRGVVTAGGGGLVLHLVLNLRNVRVPAHEELGLLLSHGTAALTDQNPYGERMLVPIGLMRGPAGGVGPVAFDVLLKDPVLRPVDTVSLYVFSDQPPELVQTASVTR